MTDNDNILYSLTVQDIQSVANQEIGRDLSEAELKMVSSALGGQIPWYEAIANSIQQSSIPQS